jgi:hypothetical protein
MSNVQDILNTTCNKYDEELLELCELEKLLKQTRKEIIDNPNINLTNPSKNNYAENNYIDLTNESITDFNNYLINNSISNNNLPNPSSKHYPFSDGEEYSSSITNKSVIINDVKNSSLIQSVNSSIMAMTSPKHSSSKKMNKNPLLTSVTIDLINNKATNNLSSNNVSHSVNNSIKVNRKRSESNKSDNFPQSKSKKLK